MSKEIDLWNFVAARLRRDESVTLLVVAESSGSSPGRAGYKMAVASDGELCGSIGGGLMEVELAERAKVKGKGPESAVELIEQVHRRNVPNSSGMICSGRQSVIAKRLSRYDLTTIDEIIRRLDAQDDVSFEISNLRFEIIENSQIDCAFSFSQTSETDFEYREKLGCKENLFIIGGGHCALALSEVASRLGFRISIFDDRPSLNTLDKNRFADEITRLDSYENIADHVPDGDDVFIVVMTLGYVSDAVVIRRLIGHNVKYLGVLGSKAKMTTLIKELKAEGFDPRKLARISTPIGIKINSRTPEEIAVSIAAEMIAVRNGANLSR